MNKKARILISNLLILLLVLSTFSYFYQTTSAQGLPDHALEVLEGKMEFGKSQSIFDESVYSNNDLDIKFKDRDNGKDVIDLKLKSHPNVNYNKRIKSGELGTEVDSRKIAIFYEITAGYGLKNALDNPIITDMETGELVNPDWRFVYAIEEEYEEPVYSCENNQTCSQTGTETKTREVWYIYENDFGRNLNKGKTKLGVEVAVNTGDFYDIVLGFGGKRISKHSPFSGSGAGTIGDPYQITDWIQLNETRDNIGYYKLMNSLDSSANGYSTVASATANGGSGWKPMFLNESWSIDGDGKIIHDLVILGSSDIHFSNEGNFTDLGFQDFTISTTVAGAGLFRLIAGGNLYLNNVSAVNGTVSGVTPVGGMIASLQGSGSFSIINNTYVRGVNVTGNSSENRVGGFVGRVADSPGGTIIGFSYSVGTLSNSGSGGVGGFAGVVESSSSTISNTTNFWDTDVSGTSISAAGSGETTADMKTITTFSGAGWDIVSGIDKTHVWGLDSRVIEGYPFLQSNIEENSPTITLNSPANLTNSSNSQNTFNATIFDDTEVDIVKLYGNFSGSWASNETNSSGINNSFYTFTIGLPDGYYVWSYWANDSFDNSGFSEENRTVTIDTISPVITIDYPGNTTYSSSPSELNYTISDINLRDCWYSLDNGVTNSSKSTSCINFTGLSAGTGLNTWTVYSDDYSNNFNVSRVSFTIESSSPEGGTASSGGTTIIVSEGNWTISTDTRGSKYNFLMASGSIRSKDILFENLGENDRTIDLSCENIGDSKMCDYVTFEDNELILKGAKETVVFTTFTISLPEDIEAGSYLFNIKGIDDLGNSAILTVEISVGGIFSEIFGKLVSSRSLFGITIPYAVIYMFFLFIIPVLTFNIFNRNFFEKKGLWVNVLLSIPISAFILLLV